MATDTTDALDLRFAFRAMHGALNIDTIGRNQVGVVAATPEAGLALHFNHPALEQLLNNGMLAANRATAVNADPSELAILANQEEQELSGR